MLARLHVLQGRLRQAAATYAQVVQAVPRPEVLQTLFTSFYYYFGLGDLLREWNDLDAAERHLVQGMALVKETLTVEPFAGDAGLHCSGPPAAGTWQHPCSPRDPGRFGAIGRAAPLRCSPADPGGCSAGAARAGTGQPGGSYSLGGQPVACPPRMTTCAILSEGEYLALARVRIAQGA